MGRLLALIGLFGTILAAPPAALAESQQPYAYTGQFSFDIAKVPFSRYGSHIVFSELTPENPTRFQAAGVTPGLHLRSVRGVACLRTSTTSAARDCTTPPIPGHPVSTWFLRIYSSTAQSKQAIPKPQ